MSAKDLELAKRYYLNMVDFNVLRKISHSTSILKVLDHYGVMYTFSSGGRYKAVCPFHNDHTPSLVIYTHEHHQDESFCCYVDGSAGDPFRFIQLMEADFRKAWSVLCHINGISDKDANTLDSLDLASRQIQETHEKEDVSIDTYNFQISVMYRNLLKQYKETQHYSTLSDRIDKRFYELDKYLDTSPSPAQLRQYYLHELQHIKLLQTAMK